MAVVYPYVKNTTWADGSGGATPDTAAKKNIIEDGVFNAHNAPCVRVSHSTTQSCTSGVFTSLAFNSEAFDQAGGAASTMHDTVTNNSRLTCRYAGIYLIGGHIDWEGIAAGTFREIRILMNAAAVLVDNTVLGQGDQRQTISTLYAMAVNDYVELQAAHDRGSNLLVDATTNSFWMTRVG